jgi:hypothetical protein
MNYYILYKRTNEKKNLKDYFIKLKTVKYIVFINHNH